MILPLFASGRAVRARSRAAQDTLAEANALATENLGAIRIMQAFNAEPATRSRFAAAAEGAYVAARDATSARALLTGFGIFLATASVVGVLWLGAHDVLSGRMSAGQLSQFLLYALFGASSLGQLSEVWSEISAAAGAAGRIAEILATQPQVTAPAHPRALPTPPRGEIAFENVSFAYPGRPDRPVFYDLEFYRRAGRKSRHRRSLRRRQVHAVPTADALLRSARGRRAHRRRRGARGRPGAMAPPHGAGPAGGRWSSPPAPPTTSPMARPARRLKEIEAAADQAAALDFLRALPEGLETRLGERGVTLSGGQRQRLAIARAILKDAPILLLDEATSALDAENEVLVQEALDHVMQGRTTLVIAHRLATVLAADRILVMDGGTIVEQGRHADLVARDGLYARLARLQFNAGIEALAV